MGLMLLVGLPLALLKPSNRGMYVRDGFVLVGLCWIGLSLFGALPFYISGEIPSYVDALFETVSGFTTTGASILTNVEAMSKGLLFWRSFSHWVGGMGVLVFVMAILPLSGAKNMHIMRAESPGPEVSKIVPRIKRTAIILYALYISLTLLSFLLLLPKMSVYDAACTAIATAGTGGFGIYNDSMASFSPYVQVVVTVFMLLFSINFNSYFLVLRARFKDAFNAEVRTFLIIVAVAIGAISLNLYLTGTLDSYGDSLRHSAFTVASLISTSGFATLNFDLWPTLSKTLLVLIMFVGACAGSTGGGLKVSRILILLKGMLRELGMILRPRQIKKITIDKRPIDNDVVRSVNAYIVTYAVVFVVSLILLSLDGYTPTVNMATGSTFNPIVTNFTAVASTMNNIGPGLEMVGPVQNFAFYSPFSKIVLIFDMLAGRLELFPMLLLFSPFTWQRRRGL